MAKSGKELLALAGVGARVRYEQLQAEIANLVRFFPELASGRGRQAAEKSTGKRGRRKMSAAQRQAVSERMKSYWANRKK